MAESVTPSCRTEQECDWMPHCRIGGRCMKEAIAERLAASPAGLKLQEPVAVLNALEILQRMDYRIGDNVLVENFLRIMGERGMWVIQNPLAAPGDSKSELQKDAHLTSRPTKDLLSARLWIDTEFNEFRGELISIAIVDEQGREFYEVLPPPLVGYGPWVAQHVVPILNKAATTRVELQAKLHVFLAKYSTAHLIADWPEDIEHFLQLLIIGPGERIGPDRWTMEVRRDLPNTADTSLVPHNALEDAKALRAADLAACEAVAGSAKPDEKASAVGSPVSAVAVSEALQVLTALVKATEYGFVRVNNASQLIGLTAEFNAVLDRARSLVGALQGVKE